MHPDLDNRRVPLTPQLALRVAGIGVTAFVLFGIIFFRLWYLQVLDGDKYLAEARENRVRVERVEAPRGQIRDANNITVVDNRQATVVSLDPARLPESYRSAALEWGRKMGRWEQRRRRNRRAAGKPPAMPRPVGAQADLYRRLARVLQISPETINRRVVRSLVQVPYADVKIKTVTAAQRDYLVERRRSFPGVTVEKTYVRKYPYGSVGAILWGKVGQILPDQLKQERFKGVAQDANVGQTGLEYEYDQYLRGVDGTNRIEVNALGERRAAVSGRRPQVGRSLRLTLDIGLQERAEAAVRTVGGGKPGAFVAMNPNTGAIYALGSLPSFNPRELNSPFATQEAWEAKFGEAAGAPLYNRATGGLYPTGSIFKPITALAAMQAGVVTPDETFNDTGCLRIGAREADVACNAGKTANGPVDMRRALEVSSDTYFYNLGLRMYRSKGLPLQSFARKLGLGQKTGIDLPYEEKGTLPDPNWVREINRRELECRKRTQKQSCGIGSGNAVWLPGFETNLAVGQGDLQATPLQMAVAYSAIVNGGRVVKPYLVDQIEDHRGVVQTVQPTVRRTVKIDAAQRQAVMEGLFRAANGGGGTSTDVWKDGWPHDRFPIYGKTGTAERPPRADQSWYAVYSYDKHNPDARPIVVIVTIEEGGWGAQAAAPAARLILSKWFGVKPQLKRGSSHTR